MIPRRIFIPLALFFVALAAAIRLPDLGFKPLMHDESLFSYFSWYLWKHGAMEYDPILHGPLLLQVNAVVYALFGDTDTTMRLYCALCGIGVVALIVWLRPMRDDIANLAAALLLAASPAMCYYSRFCRNDMDFVFFTTLWVGACAKYWRTRRARWGALAIGAFAALACDKENIVFLIATATGFGALMIAVDVVAGGFGRRSVLCQDDGGQDDKRRDGSGSRQEKPSILRLLLIANNIALVLLFIAYLLCRRSGAVAALPAWAILMAIVFGAPCLSVPAVFLYWAARTGAEGLLQRVLRRVWQDRYILGSAAIAGMILFLLVYNYWQIGRFSPVGVAQQICQWIAHGGQGQVDWLKPAQTANSAGTLGFFDIIGKAVSYWWGQHAEHRLRGPLHYYVTILIIYEWPALILTLVGGLCGLLVSRARILGAVLGLAAAGVLAWLCRNALSPAQLDKLFHIQSYAQLTLTAIFSALFVTLTVAELLHHRRARAFLIFWTCSSLLAYSYAGEKVPWLIINICLPLLMLAGDYFAAFSRTMRGWLTSGKPSKCWMGIAIISLALIFAIQGGIKWSLDTGRLLGNGFDPDERLIYNHTTPETKVYAEEILQTRERFHAQGKEFRLTLLGEASWPLLWYLRDLEGNDMDTHDDLTTSSAEVIVCDPADLERFPFIKSEYEQWSVPLREAWVPPAVSVGRRLMNGADPVEWPAYEPALPGVEREWLWQYWWARKLFPPKTLTGVTPILGDKFIYAVKAQGPPRARAGR